MAHEFAAFPEEEHRERLGRARAAMREAGYDVAICVAPESLYYIGGYDSWTGVNSPQALVFGVDGGDPTLIVRNVDLWLALETTWVTDIRTYHLNLENAAQIIADVAREKGIGSGKVGIDLWSASIPGAFALQLIDALAPAKAEDFTELTGGLRLVKSARELEYLRQAAKYAQVGLDTAVRELRPGMTEIEYAGLIEGAMRAAGSDYPSIPTELASGFRTPGGHGTAREKTIETGDLVHLEFAGVSKRYHTTAIQTLAAGDPGPRARDIYRLNVESLRAGVNAIRPGVPVAEIEEASLEPLRPEGLEGAAMMRFGYGIGIAYPPIWLESLQIDRWSKQTLEPGMVFVLHACLELVDERLGAIQGGTYTLTESGLEMLAGAGDTELTVV